MLFALFVYLFIYYLLTRLPVLLARSFGPWVLGPGPVFIR